MTRPKKIRTSSDPTRLAQNFNRRRVITALGSTAVAGGLLARRATTEAAAVSVDELVVEDRTFEANAVDPVLDATIAYEYEAEAAEELTVWLAVADDQLTDSALFVSGGSGNGEVELTAPVTDSDAFDADDFDPAAGESLSVDVPLTVGIEITADESVIADATVDRTVTIGVEHAADETAEVTIGGVVEVSDND